MTSLRYGFSFIISTLLYGALGYALFAFLESPKKLQKKPPEKVIKIAVITPKPKVIQAPIIKPKAPVITPPKEIVKPKPKPKPKKVVKKVTKKPKHKPKPKHKKIVKKIKPRPKPKPRKVVKKIKPKPKKIVQQMVKPVIEEEYFAPTEVVMEPTPPAVIVPTPSVPAPQPKVDKSAEKRAFLRDVRGSIISNKRYPKMALRRHTEGSVGVMFDIDTNGNVSNIRFLNGKSILQKAVRKAVLRSFPIAVPSNIRGELPMYNISVNVNFRIN